MSAERPSPPLSATERAPRNEQVEQFEKFSGLHARLLLADKDYMDPKSEFPKGQEKRIKRLAKRNYQPFERTSEHDRNQFWETMVQEKKVEDSTEARYALWQKNLVGSINDLSAEKRKDVFDPLFRQMGIVKSNEDEKLNNEDTNTLHDRYFSKEKREKDPKHSGVKQFVRDILEAHTENEEVNMDKLKQQLPDIKNFAIIFGEESANMIEQLIIAEARFKTDHNFVKKLPANRKNNLLPEERHVLEHINEVYQTEKAEKAQALEEKLPIMKFREQLKEEARDKDTILLVGGTGCGKTVGFPFMIRDIMQEEREQGRDPGKFIITEPTVINTENLTKKIASDGVATLGEEVDYQHGRREGSYNKDADTVLMTQGSLINRFLKGDDNIKSMRYLMIDEAHALSTDTVLLMALAKKEQQRREEAGEPSLKIFVASATINESDFQEYLGVDHIMKIPGEIQKIDQEFLEEPIDDLKKLPEAIAERVGNIIKSKKPGDIIDFVPGKPDIKKTLTEVDRVIGEYNPSEYGEILPPMGLHSKSTADEKEEATKRRSDNKRRIINATNFAETGITVEGLKFVIDTGLKKEMIYDPRMKMQVLKVVKASRDECMQRRGRVGRIEPGEWFPLFTKNDFEGNSTEGTGQKRPPHIEPEILQTDLKDTILLLKKHGTDIRDLDLLYTPDAEKIKVFEDDLVAIGALERVNGTTQATEIGKAMVDVREVNDIHAKRMIAEAKLHHPELLNDISTIVTLIEGKSPFSTYRQSIKQAMNKMDAYDEDLIDKSSDFITFLNIWKAYIAEDEDTRKMWAQKRGLDPRVLDQVEERKQSLLQVNSLNVDKTKEQNSAMLKEIIQRSYADRVMKLKSNDGQDNEGTYIREDGTDVDLTIGIFEGSFIKPREEFSYPQRILYAGIETPDSEEDEAIDAKEVEVKDKVYLSLSQVVEPTSS